MSSVVARFLCGVYRLVSAAERQCVGERCMNGGTCREDFVNGTLFTCICRTGYDGPLCQYGTSCIVTHTHTRLTALFPGLPGWAGSPGTRKVKQIWILLKQETVSGSGISWAICKSVPCSRQTTTPALHHSVFYRPDAFPAAQPTASKHRRQTSCTVVTCT